MSRVRDLIAKRDGIGKAGRRAERRVLRDLGARPVPASGATDRAKGDGEHGEFLVEVKSTSQDSFRLTRELLGKVTGQARATGMTPAVEVVFTDGAGQPVRDGDWVVVPAWAFREMTR